MQTRLVAATSAVCAALAFAFLALRSSGAQNGTEEARRLIGPPPATLGSSAHATHVGATEARHQSAPPDTSPSPHAEAEAALRLKNQNQRTAALCDALALWSTADAGDALVWLTQHPEQDQAVLLQSIGEGLAADPAAATFAMTFLAQDHEAGALLAGALVQALAAQGDGPAAVRLARATPEGWTHEWATVAYASLAYEDATTALESLATINDPALRSTTAAAIIAGWSARDPAGLARYAEPSGVAVAALDR